MKVTGDMIIIGSMGLPAVPSVLTSEDVRDCDRLHLPLDEHASTELRLVCSVVGQVMGNGDAAVDTTDVAAVPAAGCLDAANAWSSAEALSLLALLFTAAFPSAATTWQVVPGVVVAVFLLKTARQDADRPAVKKGGDQWRGGSMTVVMEVKFLWSGAE